MAVETDLWVRGNLVIPADELRETASRSGGPGGQHVNKANTRVTLHWCLAESRALSDSQRRRVLARLGDRVTRAGNLVVHASRHRSRARNRELARERLAELVRDALRTQRRRVPTRESAASKRRTLEAKRRRSDTKRGRRRVERDRE
ncbi:MAG: alternative ribosome rescue aminoacyl-tRNA hydrolase ArfB [Myxococcota bacterium]